MSKVHNAGKRTKAAGKNASPRAASTNPKHNPSNATRAVPRAELDKIKPIPRFPRTDIGNAELFALAFANVLRYDHSRERWLIWRGSWWSQDTNGVLHRMAKQVPRFLRKIAETDDDSKWARTSEFKTRLDAMLALARGEFPLADDGKGWDADSCLLGVANGVVDLRTAKLRDGRQSDKITMHTAVAYDPDATCPRWEQFLKEIFLGDQELIAFVHRTVGYGLTGSTEEQAIFMCLGAGANGKSTFLDVLRYVFGPYAANLPFTAFELASRSSIPNDIAGLEGKRLVTSLETSENAQLNESRIKWLTGSDPITARFLYKEFVTFNPTAKFFLAFNHAPKVNDNSFGFWRRIRLIPFSARFSGDNQDKQLPKKLKAEGAGILAWAVRGALAWRKEGLNPPAIVERATDSYQAQSDPLVDFIADRCVLRAGARVTAKALWANYLAWAEENGEDTLGRQSFARAIQALGATKIRHGRERTRMWLGITLQQLEPAVDELVHGPQGDASNTRPELPN